ncbi:putative fatty acyl-CoA reductase CG5065 [Planococcus citri]|uniref:putative fatty acyl-CoA reductase CG5065 n=1 Tax=Planococcus citri TaxID=170843 RepID=UPI0031F80411
MEPKPIIPEFYDCKKVLITGATGFIGKVMIWKLLQSCPNIDTIYVLIRAKWGKSDEQRLEELFHFPIFDNFKKNNPEILKKVALIQGDMQQKDLNLSESDRRKLQDEITVVFHIAAVLKMNATLKEAVEMNVEATMTLLNICTSMRNLKVFVYVSTTYCYCDKDVTDNKVYPAKNSPDEIIKLVRCLDSELLEKMTPDIIKPHPNTYTYSKRLAENVVSDFYPRLPVVIARPSTVISSHKEPFPGFVDNMNGVVGIMIAVGKGVLRSIYAVPDYPADLIPVDNVCNGLVALAWEVAENKEKQDSLPVYNICLSRDEIPTWGELMKFSYNVYLKCPLSIILWYPSVTMNKYKPIHIISTLLFQWIPAYLIDFLMMLLGYERILVRVQRKIALGCNLLTYFSSRAWRFDNSNVIRLRNSMNTSDQAIFPVNPKVIDLADRELFMYKSLIFAREFILKEDNGNIPRSIRNLKILYVLHCVVRILFYSSIFWMIYKICNF